MLENAGQSPLVCNSRLTIEHSDISESAERLRILRIDLEELAHLKSLSASGVTYLRGAPHIKDLNAMCNGLRADNHVRTIGLDLSPDDWRRLRRKSAKVHQLALFRHLSKRGTICLSDGDEVSALQCDTPRSRALTAVATELCVSLEIVHIDPAAGVCLVGVSCDSFGLAIGASNSIALLVLFESVVPLALVLAGSSGDSPGRLLPSI